MIFDTHAHYDSHQFDDDRDQLLQNLPNHGVELVLCPGCDIPSSQHCVDIATKYDYIYAAVGFHPENLENATLDDLDTIKTMATHPKVRAIGEIGLDYYWEKDEEKRANQRKFFHAQMELARTCHRPVIVHDRDAHQDSMDVVRCYPDVPGVFHCYSGSVEQAKVLVDMGWMLSFTGVITFKNARRALEVLEYLPLDRIMLETDAPYMSPEPFRGKRCTSDLICYMAEKLGEIKGISPHEAQAITLANGKRFFGLE